MDNTTKELIKGFIEKGEEKLRAAKELLSHGFYEDAVSRAYYCAFHAAQALILSEGEKALTHKGVVTLFGLLFIKTKKFDRKYGKILSNLKDDRETGDYEIFSWLDQETAEISLKEAEEFIQEVKNYFSRIEIIH